MYEARQNKEKVSRRIDTDSMVRQRVKEIKTNTIIQKKVDSKFIDWLYSLPPKNFYKFKNWYKSVLGKSGYIEGNIDKTKIKPIKNSLKNYIPKDKAYISMFEFEEVKCVCEFIDRQEEKLKEDTNFSILEVDNYKFKVDENNKDQIKSSLSPIIYKDKIYRTMSVSEAYTSFENVKLSRSINLVGSVANPNLFKGKWVSVIQNQSETPNTTEVIHEYTLEFSLNKILGNFLNGKNIILGEDEYTNACFVKSNEPNCLAIGADYINEFNTTISSVKVIKKQEDVNGTLNINDNKVRPPSGLQSAGH